MARSASYDDLLMDILKDEQRALEYLNAALEEQDPRVFLVALRNVTQAQGGVAIVAKRSGLNRESLYRALSEQGNPGIQTLAAILRVLGARLGVDRVESRRRAKAAGRRRWTFTIATEARPALCWPETRAVAGRQLAAA